MTCSHQRTCAPRNKEVDQNWVVTDLVTNYLRNPENQIRETYSKVTSYSNYKGKEGIIGNRLMEWVAEAVRKATSQPNNYPIASQQVILALKEMHMGSANEVEQFSRQ
jgi:hypothetical protein